MAEEPETDPKQMELEWRVYGSALGIVSVLNQKIKKRRATLAANGMDTRCERCQGDGEVYVADRGDVPCVDCDGLGQV